MEKSNWNHDYSLQKINMVDAVLDRGVHVAAGDRSCVHVRRNEDPQKGQGCRDERNPAAKPISRACHKERGADGRKGSAHRKGVQANLHLGLRRG